jgi:hypothetical protein
MFRGTLRYRGFAARMRVLQRLGLLVEAPQPTPVRADGSAPTPRDLLAAAVGPPPPAAPRGALVAAVAAAALAPEDGAPAAAAELSIEELDEFLEWAGLLEEKKAAPLRAPGGAAALGAGGAGGAGGGAAPPATFSPLDTLTALLTSRAEMDYAPGERDMVVMQHEVDAEWEDGRRELHTSALLQYAEPAPLPQGAPAPPGPRPLITSMARTVG